MTYELEISLFDLEIKIPIEFSSIYFLAIDTPVDLMKGCSSYFMENLKNKVFELLEETYLALKNTHQIVMRDEPGLPNALPTFKISKALDNIYENIQEIENSAIIFVGRSSLLSLAYFSLQGYLKKLKERNNDIYWLRSRNESKGGLNDYSTRAGLKSLKRNIQKRGYKYAIIIDDISITGKTLERIGNELRSKRTKVIGVPVIGNIYTLICSEYPNRKLKPMNSEIREIYEKIIGKKKKTIRKKWERRLMERMENVPIVPGLAISSPYSNTLSHLTGDTIEEARLKGLNDENLEKGLAKNFTEPLEAYGINKVKNYIIIQPRTR